MKNPLRPKFIPVLTLAAGMIGIILRIWLFSSGIDEKGLIRTAHPANTASIFLTGLVLIGIFLCLQTVCGKPPYRGLFPPSQLSAAGYWIAAAGIGCTVIQELAQSANMIANVCIVLGVATAVCLVVLGICRLKGIRPNPFLHTLVAVYLVVRLVLQYRQWSSETQLPVFFFQLMASVSLMLSIYHQAALDANLGNIKLQLFFRYSALFFCCLSIPAQSPVFYASMAIWTALCGCNFNIFQQADAMPLPDTVRLCLDKLADAGFDAYVVGGCVRDSLLGLAPQDYDRCTNASPQQIAKVFSRYHLVRNGEKHGTIGVVINGNVYEITTFRTEGGYSDCRHPDWVNFVNDVRADLARRDFTVNAIAYSPICGYTDPFGGMKDLEERVLRTVGAPAERFTEDALRILRGVRFSARYGLTPHPETEAAMIRLAYTMESLAPERIFSELCKLLDWAKADDLIRFAPVITQAIPELAPAVGFAQHSPHHRYDVYTHTVHVVENVVPELSLRWAALLHDVGKPETFTLDENGNGHFYDHAAVGARIADTLLQRLHAPNALRERVVFLVEQHMLLPELDKKLLRRRISKFGTESIKQLLQLQKADFCSKGSEEQPQHFTQLECLVDEISAEEACLRIRDLAIDGNDLMALGFQPGPTLGQALEQLLEMVLDERVPNKKDDLLSIAKEELL